MCHTLWVLGTQQSIKQNPYLYGTHILPDKCCGENGEARGIHVWICPLAGLFRDGFLEKVTVEQRPAELGGLALADVWG